MIKNKRAILGSQTPVFLLMMYLGVKGLFRGIETHNNLRIAASAAGIAIFITIYVMLIVAVTRKTSGTNQGL
ncbi:hypothetical protein [Mucilaginibacter flavus]|uniref:hypothetical protein n=1 Tax=Mucilaginibacter flavus TaxID=931504 RepID=UPI0025B3C084|nr:hypothetical protein [Mucilaginibacter flavus]MDN3580653.1 hypothetical protein [Mucilaginibacter flavus]